MKRWLKYLITTAALTFSLSFTSLAGQWHQDMAGRWFENDDGSYPANGWHWVDGDNDGIAECYYFDLKGYAVTSNGRADGCEINEEGAWMENGVVQTKDVSIPNDPAAVEAYNAATAKNSAMDSVDANVKGTISLSSLSVPDDNMEMGLNLDMKLRNVNSGNLEYLISGSIDVDGESMPFTMFYTNGYSYIDMLGLKIKQAMPFEEALESAKDLQEVSGANSDMRNLQMHQENGETILTYSVNVAGINDMLQSILGTNLAQYEELGIGMDYRVIEANGRAVIDANGYYKEETIYMDMEMTMTDYASGESETVRMKLDLATNYVNPGQPAQFELPSTEGYFGGSEMI